MPRVGGGGDAVVVLTGGDSRRMGSHKPSLRVGDRSLVSRVVDAARPRPTLVVGLPDDVPDGIPVIREDPPGGGPVAALGAAVDTLSSSAEPPERITVLAADLPFVTTAHLDRLAAALDGAPDADLAVTTDPSGHANWLCATWRVAGLQPRLQALRDTPGGPLLPGLQGRSMRQLARGATVVEVPDEGGLALDVDTPQQLEAARSRALDERA